MNAKPRVGEPVGPLSVETLGGGTVTVGEAKARWTMLFVYRGNHCPRCKRFLNKLNSMLQDWTSAMDVLVVSADKAEKARMDQEKFSWNFDLAFGLTEDQSDYWDFMCRTLCQRLRPPAGSPNRVHSVSGQTAL